MNFRYLVGPLVMLVLLSSAEQADAQSAEGKDASATIRCTDIDFMGGTWEVRGSDGRLDATLRIDLAEGHCSSLEHWDFTKAWGGKQVTCLMVYGNRQHDWARLCTGFTNGDRYRSAEGKLVNGTLNFKHDDNATVAGVVQTVSLVKLPDGRIHEIIKESSDGGKEWKIVDETFYTRTRK